MLGQCYPSIIPIFVDEVQGSAEKLREVHPDVKMSVIRGSYYRKYQNEGFHTPYTLIRSRIPLQKPFASAKARHRYS